MQPFSDIPSDGTSKPTKKNRERQIESFIIKVIRLELEHMALTKVQRIVILDHMFTTPP